MAMQKVSVGTLIAMALAGVVVSAFAAILATRTIPSTGIVTTAELGVYSNSACTDPVSSIDWGYLTPGSTSNKTVYIRNEGNTAVTLNMSASGWNPFNAGNYITLTWNRDGYTLSSGSVVSATFNLTVSSQISGIQNFSFNITITGTA